MAANQDEKLTPGGKVSDGSRFTVSSEDTTQEERSAEVERSAARWKNPHTITAAHDEAELRMRANARKR